MDAKVIANNIKDNVDEISSSTTSDAKSIYELNIYVASTKKSSDTAIRKIVSLAKKWRSSADDGVQGGCTLEKEPILTVKAEDGGTEGVSGDNSVENTIEGTKGGRYIEMGKLKSGASNEVLSTEVLVVRKNVASWVWLTPLIGSNRVGLFVLDPVSWSIYGGWRESSF